MAVPTFSGEQPPGREGLIDHLRSLAASIAAYLGARLELAGIESREAAGHYMVILALLGAVFFGLVFGYIFLWLALVFIIHYLFNVNWFWIMLGAAGFHFIAAGVAALIAKAKFPKAMFTGTIAEFKKDQSWLNNPGPTIKPN